MRLQLLRVSDFRVSPGGIRKENKSDRIQKKRQPTGKQLQAFQRVESMICDDVSLIDAIWKFLRQLNQNDPMSAEQQRCPIHRKASFPPTCPPVQLAHLEGFMFLLPAVVLNKSGRTVHPVFGHGQKTQQFANALVKAVIASVFLSQTKQGLSEIYTVDVTADLFTNGLVPAHQIQDHLLNILHVYYIIEQVGYSYLESVIPKHLSRQLAPPSKQMAMYPHHIFCGSHTPVLVEDHFGNTVSQVPPPLLAYTQYIISNQCGICFALLGNSIECVVIRWLTNYIPRENNDQTQSKPSELLHDNPLDPIPESPEEEADSTASPCESDDSSEDIDGLLADGEIDLVPELDAHKKYIVDDLMVYVYEMFAPTGFTTCTGNSGSSSTRESRVGEPSTNSSRTTEKKRSLLIDDHLENQDEEEDDECGKRRKTSNTSTPRCPRSGQKLACPYFKREPHKHEAAKACRGPGWSEVSRLKEHLYRHHARPLHCPRCYLVFADADALTKHLRSLDDCIRQSLRQMKGFDENQMKELKNKRTMHRAGSEEHKWRLIYLILFPNTTLSEMPSPYYEFMNDKLPVSTRDDSPESSQVQQMKAEIDRILPGHIRKAVALEIEKMVSPIAEMVRSRLPNIIKDCQEAIMNDIMSGAHTLTDASQEAVETAQQARLQPEYEFAGISGTSHKAALALEPHRLSQFAVPLETAPYPWPEISQFQDNANAQAPFSDSANFSLSDNAQGPPSVDEWQKLFTADDILDSRPEENEHRHARGLLQSQYLV